jgi:hypothetical protein
MTIVDPPTWYKELIAWKSLNLHTAIGLAIALLFMATGSIALVVTNWAESRAFAPFALGCALATGVAVFVGVIILHLGHRGAAKAHLANSERITELGDRLDEQNRLIARQGELIELQTKLIEQMAGELQRMGQVGSDRVEQQRRKARGE